MTYHVTLQGVEVEFAPPKITHIVVNHNLKCISYHLSHFRGCRFWGCRFYFCTLYITINSINPHYTAHWGGYVVHTSQKVNCLLYYKGIHNLYVYIRSLPDFKSNPFSSPYFNSLPLELLHNFRGRELK